MALGSFAIEQIFDRIWETWPNKDGESSAKKAVNVYFKSGYSKDDLIKSCEAYVLENLNSDAAFTKQLSSFINQDHWRDVLENAPLDKLKRKHEEARLIIKEWNNSCRSHWCKVVDEEARVGILMSALNDKSFQSNWKEALKSASSIFRYQHRDGDIRQKIILSLSWFASTSPKHTVLRIIEGEYGKPNEEEKEAKQTVKKNDSPLTNAERMAAANELRRLLLETDIKLTIKQNDITECEKEIIAETVEQISGSDVESGIGYDSFELT